MLFRSFPRAVQEITYPVRRNVGERAQNAKIITERAVFDVAPDGLVLSEIAPGVDLKSQVLDLMDFPPVRIADPLPLMNEAYFKD